MVAFILLLFGRKWLSGTNRSLSCLPHGPMSGWAEGGSSHCLAGKPPAYRAVGHARVAYHALSLWSGIFIPFDIPNARPPYMVSTISSF